MTSEPFSLWLNTHHLVGQLTDTSLSYMQDEMIHFFGGFKQMVFMCIGQDFSHSQLTFLQQRELLSILTKKSKELKISQKETNSLKYKVREDDEKEENKLGFHFQSLSNNSLYSVFKYLPICDHFNLCNTCTSLQYIGRLIQSFNDFQLRPRNDRSSFTVQERVLHKYSSSIVQNMNRILKKNDLDSNLKGVNYLLRKMEGGGMDNVQLLSSGIVPHLIPFFAYFESHPLLCQQSLKLFYSCKCFTSKMNHNLLPKLLEFMFGSLHDIILHSSSLSLVYHALVCCSTFISHCMHYCRLFVRYSDGILYKSIIKQLMNDSWNARPKIKWNLVSRAFFVVLKCLKNRNETKEQHANCSLICKQYIKRLKEYFIDGEWKENIYYGQPFLEAPEKGIKNMDDVLLVEYYDSTNNELHLFSNPFISRREDSEIDFFERQKSMKRVINIDNDHLFPVFNVHLSLTLKYILQLMKYLITNGESYSSVTSYDMKLMMDIFVTTFISYTSYICVYDEYYITKVYQLFLELQSLDVSINSSSLMIVTEVIMKAEENGIIFGSCLCRYVMNKMADDYHWNEIICDSKANAVERFLTSKENQKQFISDIDCIGKLNKMKLVLLFLQYIANHSPKYEEISYILSGILIKIRLEEDLHMLLFANGNGHILLIRIMFNTLHDISIDTETHYNCMYYCCSTLQLLVNGMKKYLKNDRNDISYKKNISIVIDTCVEGIISVITEPLFYTWIQFFKDIHCLQFLKSLIIHPKVIDLLFANKKLFREMCKYLYKERHHHVICKIPFKLGYNDNYRLYEKKIAFIPILVEFWLHFIQFATEVQRAKLMIAFNYHWREIESKANSSKNLNDKQISAEQILCDLLMSSIQFISAWEMIDREYCYEAREHYAKLFLETIESKKKLQKENCAKLCAIRLMIDDYKKICFAESSKVKWVKDNENHRYCFAFFDGQMRDKLYDILMNIYNGNGQRTYFPELNVVCLDLLSTYFQVPKEKENIHGNDHKIDEILGLKQNSFYENVVVLKYGRFTVDKNKKMSLYLEKIEKEIRSML